MKLLREPLVHFLALGAGLFGLFALVGDGGAERGDRIVITDGDIARLEETWARQWRRPPTADELEGLIQSQIREEILYREALAMGLDDDDTIIRRRLAQKMEFLSEDLAMQAEPAEEELEAFLDENPERFGIPARLTFTHIYFSPDRRGDATREDAERVLSELAGAAPDRDVSSLGDRFMLQKHFADRSQDEIGQLFGRAFGESILGLEPGRWHGPVTSGYGQHLVFVHEHTDPRLPELAEVRDNVRQELFAVRRKQANEALYQALSDRYEIVIEGRESEAVAQEQDPRDESDAVASGSQ